MLAGASCPQAGAADDSSGSTTDLHAAASQGDQARLAALLAAGAFLEAADEEGKAPLAAAAANGQEACLRQLLAAGASIEGSDRHGHVALHWAAACGREGCVAALVAAGADLERSDCNGLTAMQLAAGKGQVACMEALAAAGASLGAADRVGNSALHIAACNGHLAAIRWLVAADPSPAAMLARRNGRGQTAWQVAAEYQQRAAERLLAALERRCKGSSGGCRPVDCAGAVLLHTLAGARVPIHCRRVTSRLQVAQRQLLVGGSREP